MITNMIMDAVALWLPFEKAEFDYYIFIYTLPFTRATNEKIEFIHRRGKLLFVVISSI